MKHWASKVGIVLLLLAVAPYVYVQYRLRSHNWTPLGAPVGKRSANKFHAADVMKLFQFQVRLAFSIRIHPESFSNGGTSRGTF